MNQKAWTVCVVEPNKFEGQIIVDLLRNAGVDKVKLVADQAAAIELLEVYNANVVIAAFEMAPLDGAEWTRAYRRNHKLPGRKQAIFVTSGAFSLAVAEQCRHAGANALIGKPISAKVLIATISKVLSKPREFIDAEGYVGPCRRAGIVTAGGPKARRKADAAGGARTTAMTLEQAVEALAAATGAYAGDPRRVDACEAALRVVHSYAVNAGDGPLMRACAAFTLQVNASRSQRNEAARAALDACLNGVIQLAALELAKAEAREAIAEHVRQAVAKAAMQRAA
ncbi:MAG: response regulator [Hyphomonadaceae bacterium]